MSFKNNILSNIGINFKHAIKEAHSIVQMREALTEINFIKRYSQSNFHLDFFKANLKEKLQLSEYISFCFKKSWSEESIEKIEKNKISFIEIKGGFFNHDDAVVTFKNNNYYVSGGYFEIKEEKLELDDARRNLFNKVFAYYNEQD